VKRKFFIILFMIIAIITSCSGKEDVNAPAEVKIDENQNEFYFFELTSVSPYFDSLYGGGFGDKKEAANWVEIIESKYNIKVQISSEYQARFEHILYNISYESSEYDYIKKGIEEGFISGLFYTCNSDILKQLVENELILPLDSLLMNNENWKGFPFEWKQAYTFNDSIWALPTRSEKTVSLRSIRLDWLDYLNLKTPETITDFYNIINAFTYRDPDNDSKNNTSGAVHSGLSGVEDLFNSFDARLNISGNPGPVWNPNTNLWEDSVMKPEFRKCLEFIIKCDSEKVFINNEIGRYDNGFYSGYSGSLFYINRFDDPKESILKSRPDTERVDIGYIYGLSHIIDKNVTGIVTEYSNPVFLTTSSQNPEDTINIYINIFLSDFDGYIMGRYGSSEKITVLNENTIAYEAKNSDGKVNIWPGIVSVSPKFNYTQVPDYNPEISMASSIKQSIIENQLGENELFYIYPWNDNFMNLSLKNERVLKGLGTVANRIVTDIVNGKVGIDEGLAEYEKYRDQYNIEEYISQLNGNLNDY